jgi:hypothetical protein
MTITLLERNASGNSFPISFSTEHKQIKKLEKVPYEQYNEKGILQDIIYRYFITYRPEGSDDIIKKEFLSKSVKNNIFTLLTVTMRDTRNDEVYFKKEKVSYLINGKEKIAESIIWKDSHA